MTEARFGRCVFYDHAPICGAAISNTAVTLRIEYYGVLSQPKSELDAADEISMGASSISLQGLQHADTQLENAASKIASVSAVSATGGDSVDLSQEMVAMVAAQQQFDANLATLKTEDQVEQRLVDMTG
jgi:flagellar basal body rod protein FlgB